MDALVLKSRLPDSILPYPAGAWNRIKWVFWRAISPGYLFGMHTLLKLRLIHHEGRQNFVLGKIAEGRTLDDFLAYLYTQGFANHFIAWKDDDQIVSLRRLESFEWQYHLRIFKDGEVRGHYEYTPECHPRLHSKEIGFEERRGDFLNFLGDWIN